MKKIPSILALLALSGLTAGAQKPLHTLQQEFEDLQFGLFTHWGVPTYEEADWSNPDTPPTIIDAPKFSPAQWAEAAKSAKMKFGTLSVKHHNGLCLWDTKTTDYNVMNSKLGRDVVKEYTDEFRKRGLRVIFHFSILDTHNKLRPGHIRREHIDMVKNQLRELLTDYGEVTAIIFDGWDAPWSRISYSEVPFTEIYNLVKSIQPDCLVIDMNSHKYPREELFYSDIKFYEQGAGQKIDASTNKLPAMACLPMQRTWFWKESMPTDTLMDPAKFVSEILVPYNKAHCSFVLNAAPNRNGLIDDNALKVLKEIGRLRTDYATPAVPDNEEPIVQKNIAINRPAESSWSWDMDIMDLANDDNYNTAWVSSEQVAQPWWQVDLGEEQPFDMIVITEPDWQKGAIKEYKLEYRRNGLWHEIFSGKAPEKRVKRHRFAPVKGDRVRITITSCGEKPAIAEFGVYQPL